jgi:hypothetical protein
MAWIETIRAEANREKSRKKIARNPSGERQADD